jgi:hypothetical protein
MPPLRDVMGVGMDYGTTNTTAALMLGVTDEVKRDKHGRTVPHSRLVLMDEWRYNPKDHNDVRLTDQALSHRFRQWLPKDHTPYPLTIQPRFLMLDPAAASMHMQMQQDLRGTGLSPWPAVNDVLPGIQTIANLLDTDGMVVTDRCTGWAEEVTEYRWDAKATDQGDDEVVKENDHSLDAGRYITHSTVNYWKPMLALAA